MSIAAPPGPSTKPVRPWKVMPLVVFWFLGVAYAAGFGVWVWTDPGVLLYAGHAISLLFYGVPLLLLVLVSWPLLRIWTKRRQRMPLIKGGVQCLR